MYCATLHCAAMHLAPFFLYRYNALRCAAALHCAELRCPALHCAALLCTALHCSVLLCTALHCAALHFIQRLPAPPRPRAITDVNAHAIVNTSICFLRPNSKLPCVVFLCTVLHGAADADADAIWVFASAHANGLSRYNAGDNDDNGIRSCP
jgi:hypothetical protein